LNLHNSALDFSRQALDSPKSLTGLPLAAGKGSSATRGNRGWQQKTEMLNSTHLGSVGHGFGVGIAPVSGRNRFRRRRPLETLFRRTDEGSWTTSNGRSFRKSWRGGLKRRSAARAAGARNSPGRVQADGGGYRRPDSGAEGEAVLTNARHRGSQWCYRSGYGVNWFEAQAGSGAHRVAPMADGGGSALARGEEVAA
jgi:hypothetical protein